MKQGSSFMYGWGTRKTRRSQRQSWHLKSVPRFVTGVAFAALAVSFLAVDIFMTHGEGVWRSVGVWIPLSILAGGTGYIFLDNSGLSRK